jgi:hypothetical protein
MEVLSHVVLQVVLMPDPYELLTAEREQVQKIHNMSFCRLGILL